MKDQIDMNNIKALDNTHPRLINTMWSHLTDKKFNYVGIVDSVTAPINTLNAITVINLHCMKAAEMESKLYHFVCRHAVNFSCMGSHITNGNVELVVVPGKELDYKLIDKKSKS